MPEYILTLKNKGYCLSTVLVRRGCSHTLNRLKTLNSFVETLFSPDIFLAGEKNVATNIFRVLVSNP